jgi:hypothetical protein
MDNPIVDRRDQMASKLTVMLSELKAMLADNAALRRQLRSELTRTGDHALSAPAREQLTTLERDADSDEVAWAIRDDLARGYEMMSPGFGASLA